MPETPDKGRKAAPATGSLGAGFFVDFDRIKGSVAAALEMVPARPGVYAWYRKYFPPVDDCSGRLLSDYVLKEIARPHALTRKANLRPLHQVTLKSRRIVSPSKRAMLERACEESDFRASLTSILASATLLQQPLYIGQSGDLRTRVGQHLRGDTPLRGRLEKAGVNISRCLLVFYELPVTQNEDESDGALILEEVLSKLFCPAFTSRYG